MVCRCFKVGLLGCRARVGIRWDRGSKWKSRGAFFFPNDLGWGRGLPTGAGGGAGVRPVAVGSVEAHKPDLDKELVSDFLRNAAMRFGIALTLWMKDDAPVVTPHPASGPRSAPEARTTGAGTDGPKMASDAAKRFLRTLAKERGYELPDLGSMTARDAYDLTEKLKALPKAGDEPEEAF